MIMECMDMDPKYTRMCHERTLQEEEKGFFKELVKTFTDNNRAYDWAKAVWQEKLYGLPYIEALTGGGLVTQGLFEIFNPQPMFRRKNEQAANRLRESAEQMLAEDEFQKCLNLSNQAVILSPLPGGFLDFPEEDSCQALSYSIRAECLMRTGDYDLSLIDIRAAMRTRLSPDIRGLLFFIQGRCYKNTQQLAKAKISFDIAIKLITQHPMLLESIQHEVANMVIDREAVEISPRKVPKRIDAAIEKVKNENYQNPSEIIEITQAAGMGRFTVAKKNVSIGQTIVMEEPYAACLKNSALGTHCYHCFERLKAPFGCPGCANIAFCSEECRDIAIDGYHKYECVFMELFIGSGMSVLCKIALRMVTQFGLKECLRIYARQFVNKGSPDSKNLEDKETLIYNLCTHNEYRTPEDYLDRSLMAFFLLRALRASGFFNDDIPVDQSEASRPNLNENEKKIFVLLLHHLLILQYNVHEIDESYDTTARQRVVTRTIGAAIYPTLALFNHECQQGIGRYYIGKNVVAKALKPMAQGSLLPENYGPTYAKWPKFSRYRYLRSRYMFKCECEACVKSWPTLNEMKDDDPPSFRCPATVCGDSLSFDEQGKVLKCITCKRSVDDNFMEESIKKIDAICRDYEEGERLMNEDEIAHAIQVLTAALEMFHKIAFLPHKRTNLAEQVLKHCFSMTQFSL